MLECCVSFTWHVPQAKVCDAVVVIEQDVEGVQRPRRLHQQTRSQGHHKPLKDIFRTCITLYPLTKVDLLTSTPQLAGRQLW